MELNNEHDDRISVSSNNNESFHSRVDSFTSDSRRRHSLDVSGVGEMNLSYGMGVIRASVRHGLCSAHT